MPAGFLTPLDVRLLPETNKGWWYILSPLKYYSEIMGREIIVPIGFLTDFVSFAPLKDIGQRAGVIHDYLYSCKDVDREIADKVLREALESIGIDHELADSMYDAVRVFGREFKTNELILGPPL